MRTMKITCVLSYKEGAYFMSETIQVSGRVVKSVTSTRRMTYKNIVRVVQDRLRDNESIADALEALQVCGQVAIETIHKV